MVEDDKILERLKRMRGVSAFYRGAPRLYSKKAVEKYMLSLPVETREPIQEIIEKGVNPEFLDETLRNLRAEGVFQENIALTLGMNVSTFRVDLSHLRRGGRLKTMNIIKFYQYLQDKGLDISKLVKE